MTLNNVPTDANLPGGDFATGPNLPPAGIKRRPRRATVIILSVLGGLCLCLVVALVVIFALNGAVNKEREPVTAVLDSFMKNMMWRNPKVAYDLFSPRAQRQTPFEKVAALLEGNNYALFEGYKSLDITNINITKAVNTNQDLPQGTVATVKGTVKYEQGIEGRIEAVLEKVGERWMIHNFYVSVPPDKLK